LKLVDTNVLSNFAFTKNINLLLLALPDFALTPQVITELQEKPIVWHRWKHHSSELTVVSLSSIEEENFERIRQFLGDGEASCLAILLEREGTLFTDDKDARRYAQHLDIPVSGTVGVLILLYTEQNITLAEADTILKDMIAHGYYSPVQSLTEHLK